MASFPSIKRVVVRNADNRTAKSRRKRVRGGRVRRQGGAAGDFAKPAQGDAANQSR